MCICKSNYCDTCPFVEGIHKRIYLPMSLSLYVDICMMHTLCSLFKIYSS